MVHKNFDELDAEVRLRRFYAILLEADLACLSEFIEKRRRRKK